MTLSKERVEFYATKEPPFGYTGGDIQAMARELLERRERDGQQPYGYTDGERHGMCYETRHADRLRDPQPLYRSAPPAPVMPEELLTAMEEVLRISDRQHDAWDKAKAAITTLRAAPQSFGNSEQLLEPKVPDYIAAVKPIEPNWQDPTGRDVAVWAWGWREGHANSVRCKQPVSQPRTLAEGIAAIRDAGIAIDTGKIQAELDAINSPAVPDDVRRMDWLVSKTVNVREPLVYGSHNIFWSQAITDEQDEHHATALREQIDAAIMAEESAAPKQESE